MCTKLIKPSVPTPPHLRTLKQSPVDQVQNSVKTAVVLYYSADGSTGTDQEVERRRINLLETSLSETLTRFYPLAGRYIKDGNWVDCNDEGVEFFVAKAKGRLSEFLSMRDEMIDQLSHLAGGGFTSPVLSIQINMFECGGLVIGIRISHHLVDGFSAACFITSWATASRQGMDDMIWPAFGMASILPANDLPKMKPMPALIGLDKIVTKRIVFDGAEISALRARAHDPSFPRQPSRVEVVTALIWRALMRVSRAKHGDSLRTSLAAHSINFRSRIVPPLPPWSFGNLVSRATTRFVVAAESGGFNTEVPVPELKDLVGLLIDSLTKSKETMVGREDVFSTLLRTRNELHEAVEKGEVDVYMFTSWGNFPFYEIDFGWGKPVWLSRIPLPYESTSLLDTEDGDGIEAWVCFNKQDMSLFLRDEDILAFTSKEAPAPGVLSRPQFWVTQEDAEHKPMSKI